MIARARRPRSRSLGAGVALGARPSAAPPRRRREPASRSQPGRHRCADRAGLGGPRRHRGPAALDARHEVVRLRRRAGRRRDARRGDGPHLRHRRHRPGRRSPRSSRRRRFAIRHEGTFTGGGVITLEPGADGTTTIVRWDETLVAPVLPHLGAVVAAPVFGAIFQADLVRLRDLVESGAARLRATDRAAPPRRRDLRAVPGPLRAAPAGPRAGRHPSRASPGCATSCCTCSARRARPTSAAPRTGSSSRSATTSSRATSRRPGCRPSCSPSSPSPRRRSRRSASSCGRWSSSRPMTPSAPRPSGSPRTRGSSGSSCARRTRTWPSSSATTGSSSGIGAAASTYDDAGVRAKWGVRARRRSRTGSALVGDSSDGFPGCPAGARSRPRPSSPATATTRTSRPRRRRGRSRASAARAR